MKDNYEIVYSDRAPKQTQKKTVRIKLETKGRKGKGVTTISNLPLSDSELKTFAKELKNALGSGGSVKDRVIEIQGDHVDFVKNELNVRDINFH